MKARLSETLWLRLSNVYVPGFEVKALINHGFGVGIGHGAEFLCVRLDKSHPLIVVGVNTRLFALSCGMLGNTPAKSRGITPVIVSFISLRFFHDCPRLTEKLPSVPIAVLTGSALQMPLVLTVPLQKIAE